MAQVVDRRWRKNRTTGERDATGYDGPSPWLARWRDPDGKQRSQGFARKVDAERHLTSVSHRILTGEYVDAHAGKVTVRDWCEEWRARQVHRPTTQAQLETGFRRHLYPRLGDRQLRSVRPSDVQGWVTSMSVTLAAGTVGVIYAQFAAAMKAAERDRVIGRTPCERITLPKRSRLEVVPPTLEQVEALADAMNDRWRTTVVVAAGAGLRLGEVLGLQVDRVDFLRRRITVDQQLVTLKGATGLAPPKTASSVRTVPLPDVVASELAAHLAKYPAVNGFIFTTELDLPVPRHRIQTAWVKAGKQADVGKVRFHDLRHHYASVLIAAGCSVKAVQKALGHASATETLETYAHLWPDDEDRTRAAVDRLWARSNVREMCAVPDLG